MTYLILSAPLALMALSGWQLAKGLRTGAIRNRWMILRREDDPFSYWMTVASCAVFILACAVATAIILANFGFDVVL